MSDIKLIHGDCLEVMKTIPDKSIDMILCDLPYGTTACKWDVVIPFEPLWERYKRIIKDNGCIALFGSEPFSSYLRLSNIKMYKYDWLWNKLIPFPLVGNQPSRQYETISIFYNKINFYEIKIKRNEYEFMKFKRTNNCIDNFKSPHRPNTIKEANRIRKRLPIEQQWYKKATNILEYRSDDIRSGTGHPTQKPVPLLEYLIMTYTLENETVLDNCMGSGSTGVACINLNRKFIGIEIDKDYFDIASKRISEAQNTLFS